MNLPTLDRVVLLLLLLLAGCDAPDQRGGVKKNIVEIEPKYWACTESYLSHQKGTLGGMLTRFGRTSEYKYDYWECRCKQWSAHMVGKAEKPHKACSNGWMPKGTK